MRTKGIVPALSEPFISSTFIFQPMRTSGVELEGVAIFPNKKQTYKLNQKGVAKKNRVTRLVAKRIAHCVYRRLAATHINSASIASAQQK